MPGVTQGAAQEHPKASRGPEDFTGALQGEQGPQGQSGSRAHSFIVADCGSLEP